MALGREQQVVDVRCNYVVPFQTERGGILSLTTLSGLQYAVYEPNPTEATVPLGLQQHDIETVDVYRANVPWRYRRAFPECTPYPYVIQGTVVTNAVHPAADPAAIIPGAPIYLAPSGLITVSPTYNSKRIGTFQSYLNDSSLNVPGTLGPSSMRLAGNEAIVNPEPTMIPTAGWVRIHLTI